MRGRSGVAALVAGGLGLAGLAAVGGQVEAPRPGVQPRLAEIGEIVVQESSRAGISAHLPLAIAWRESRLTNKFSDTGDAGPMQVNVGVAGRLGIDAIALLDARNSTAVGIAWLAGYLRMCGSARSAVYAYGHGRCEERRRGR